MLVLYQDFQVKPFKYHWDFFILDRFLSFLESSLILLYLDNLHY